MNRRRFLLTSVASFVTRPLAVNGQPASMPVIGYLSGRSPEDTAHLLAAFHRGLGEQGFVEKKNVAVEYRWAHGESHRISALAGELARLPLAALVSTGGEAPAVAAKTATSTIPIIFAIGSDPVKARLVAGFNRPGGNATGIHILATALEGKRLALLNEMVPHARTLAFLLSPDFPAAPSQLADAQAAGRALNVRVDVLRASTDDQIETAFTTIVQRRTPALAVAGGPFFDTRRDKLVFLAARHAVPAVYHSREFPLVGGLLSYGVDFADAYRLVGVYTGRILRGGKPADLPVEQPTKFELFINLKTAKALGLTIPPSLMLRADQIIE